MKIMFKALSRIDINLARNLLVDYYLVSHPKAGRTWIRVIIAKIFSLHFNIPFNLNLLEMKLNHPKIPYIQFTHAGSDIQSRLKTRNVRFTIPEHIRRKPVIFLARDPRDTIVSFYYQAVKRRKMFQGTISEFIRDERLGINRLIDFMNTWSSYLKNNPNSIVILYEELHRDILGAVKKLLTFIGLNDVGEEIIKDAASFASFDNMKRMEREGVFRDSILLPVDPNDPNSYKVRKGRIGSYREELSQEDIDYVERAIKRLDRFFPYR